MQKTNPKVKYASGQYINLPSAPEPEDILYWCEENSKKKFTKKELVEQFGEEREQKVDKSIEKLIEEGNLESTDTGFKLS